MSSSANRSGFTCPGYQGHNYGYLVFDFEKKHDAPLYVVCINRYSEQPQNTHRLSTVDVFNRRNITTEAPQKGQHCLLIRPTLHLLWSAEEIPTGQRIPQPESRDPPTSPGTPERLNDW